MEKKYLIISVVLLLCCNVLAQGQPPVTELHPTKITILCADSLQATDLNGETGTIAGRTLAERFGDAITESNDGYLWKIKSPKTEKYLVTTLQEIRKGDEYVVSTEKDKIKLVGFATCAVRHELGLIEIPKGESTIKLEFTKVTGRTRVRSLELIREGALKDYRRRVKEFKEASKENHFGKKDIYGIMTHYGVQCTTPGGGPSPEWPKGLESLNIEEWAYTIQSMGPSFFLMPLAWIYQYFPAPLESVEKIVPGRTTINYGGRDYIMELADALNKRGIKLYLYYHLGNKDKEFWAATTQKGKLKEREAILESVFSNWKAIVSEVGNRYGKKLAGWWFDGGMSYYPTDFEELSKVARTGNPARMICFNAYKFPAFTEFADYMGGEMYGLSKVDKVVDFKCTGGKEKGLFAFALPRVENDWTTWKGSPKIIQKPNFDATRMVLRAHDKGYTLCMNLMSYSDGSFHPDTVKGIIKARKALEAKGIKRVFKPISQK